MNSIATVQNAESQVRLLRARRRIYTQGKRLLSLQIFVTIGVPVMGAFSALVWPDVKGVVAFASIVITIIDVTVFDQFQKAIIKTAAKMQEQFDCTVLQLPWEN